MKIIDENGAAIEPPDLTLGYLVGGTEPVEHPAVEGVEEVSHYETVTEYPGGGRDVRKVIDVLGVPAQAAWTEQVPVQRYIRYTEEELAKVAQLDKTITQAEKDELVDSIIVKTQGFVNGNIKEGDKNPVAIFKNLLALYNGIDRNALRENMRYFLSAIMPVCEEYGVNMCVHPDDPPFQILGLPRIVTNEEDIAWFLNAVDNPHNGLTFCAGSLSAGEHNDTRELAKKFAKRTHFVHLRSTNAMPGGNFIESSHLEGRGHLIDLIRIFEKENPQLPMRVDHGRMMLGDEDKGYNAGYSFHGRMLALAQVEGMMAVVQRELEEAKEKEVLV